ncbi:MAG: hypothetical protein LBU34_08375 [Planctomycetaceae bacterium]|nr:hypothetical protein [Planctomycetaceae bacterium]
MKQSAAYGSEFPNRQKVGKCSPILGLTIHKVGNRSASDCLPDAKSA